MTWPDYEERYGESREDHYVEDEEEDDRQECTLCGDGGVFRDFGMDENDNQYMASPYAAFRFEGHITLRDTCK